ncbi:MAG: polymorphic toxin-type HINT domain-containing protein [Nanoarchaeota archaeon]
MKKSKLLFFTFILFLFLFSFALIAAFQGNSSSYSSDNKQDSVTSSNSTSSSFTHRFIGGIQSVGQYLINAVTGRFGILSSQVNLLINITSPLNNQEIARGHDAVDGVTGEDDKASVPNYINVTARVYDSSGNAFSSANCFFYDNDIFFGNSSTNSSGHCTMNYTKSGFSVGVRNITVNYSISTSDTKEINSSQINISIIRYVNSLTMSNTRTNGKYYDGDTAILLMSISKINVSGTSSYDPQNISANATNAGGTIYTNGIKFYPGVNITRTGTGTYSTNVTVNYSFGAFIKWDVLLSDNNYLNIIGSAVHSDVGICSGDFGVFGEWSACSGGTQTKTRNDSSGCSEVQSQSCGGDTCFLAGTEISTNNGYKNIEEVRVGDKILSYNESSKNTEVSEVLNTFRHETDSYLVINEKLKLTGNHPIFINGDWRRADSAKLNDYLTDINGNDILIKSIQKFDSNETVYNLEIKDTHTYYAENLLVHNKGGCNSTGYPDWNTIPWGACFGGQQNRTRTDNCDNSETQFQPCGCVANWQCGLWGVCSSGTQTRTCNDLNQCDLGNSSYVESQQCITNLQISYNPQNLNIDIANGTSINFDLNANGQSIGAIDIKWYLNGNFQKGDSGLNSVASSFSHSFFSTSVVRVDITAGAQSQSVSWNINILSNATGSCNENWYCHWNSCDETGYRYSEDCTDLNLCGTDLNRPLKQACSCIPEFECTDWSSCLAEYDFSNVFQGNLISNGTQTRICVDKLGCENTTIELMSCSLKSSVISKKVKWCFQDYIEIYDSESGKLLSRIRDYSDFGNRRVDVGIIGTDFQGYCHFCYDGVKNYDETGIDCGGSSCGACLEKGKYFDWIIYLKLSLWLLLLLILIYIMWKNRKNIGELFNKVKSRSEIKRAEVKHLEVRREGIRSALRRIFVRTERVKEVKHLEVKREPSQGILRSIGERLKSIRLPSINISIRIGKRVARLKEARRVRKEFKIKERILVERKPEKILVKRRHKLVFFSDLSRKLREWKERRYYDTSGLENKLTNAIKQKISEVRARRKISRHQREIVREEKRRVRELVKSKYNELKLKKKKERFERRHTKKQIKHIHKRIKRKSINKNEISSLRKQIKGWENKGYDTSDLHRKLDEFEGRNPLK